MESQDVDSGHERFHGATAADANRAPAGLSRRAFWGALAGILLVGLCCRAVMLHEAWTQNPLARTPVLDPATYWKWAGEIADGKLVGDTPFLSAPLYSYVLGLVRAAGGGLLTVYVIQLVVHLATAACVAWMGRTRFGGGVGLLAAGLFLLATEPAFDSMRLLHGTLQLALVCVLWMQLLRVQQRPSLGRSAVAGLLAVVNCLANPPMLLLLVLGGGWLLVQAGRPSTRLLRVAVYAAVATLVGSTATVHNWLACGEFIPITAHGGIAFRHGNAPGAKGAFTSLPRISIERDRLYRDAVRLYTEETGRPQSWRAADVYFRKQGLEYWRADPLRAIELAGRKLYLFLAARNAAVIYIPNAEIKVGLGEWLARLAPLPTALLVGPALVGLAVMLRRPVRYAPEWMLVAVPLFVVVVFMYSPRYRVPAVPVLCVAAAWALLRAVQWRAHRRWSIAVGVALAASVASGFVNRIVEVEALEPQMIWLRFQLGYALEKQGKLEEAVAEYHRGLAPGPGALPPMRIRLAGLLVRLDRTEEACEQFRIAHRVSPDDVGVTLGLADTLLRQRMVAEAEDVLHDGERIHPNAARVRTLLHRASGVRRELEARVETCAQTLESRPQDVETRLALGRTFVSLQRLKEAAVQYRAVLELSPEHFEAQHELGRVLAQRGRPARARKALEAAVRIRPDDADALYDLAGVYLKLGRLEQAAARLREVLLIDPQHYNARAVLRQVRQSIKKQGAAREP